MTDSEISDQYLKDKINGLTYIKQVRQRIRYREAMEWLVRMAFRSPDHS